MARSAGCSTSYVRLLEGGFTPGAGPTLDAVQNVIAAALLNPTKTEATLASVASEKGDRVITTAPARPVKA